MPRFDRIFCVCTSDRELLIQRRVSADKVMLHFNGVDKPKVKIEDRPREKLRIRELWRLPAEYGVNENAVCFGVVGRLSPEKRHHYILEVFKNVVDQSPGQDCHLVVFGRGALEGELKSATERLGLSSRVH